MLSIDRNYNLTTASLTTAAKRPIGAFMHPSISFDCRRRSRRDRAEKHTENLRLREEKQSVAEIARKTGIDDSNGKRPKL